MKTISIGFIRAYNNKNSNIISRIVAWWTRGIYSHTYIKLNDTIYEASPRHFKVVKYINNNKIDNCDIKDIKVTSKQYEIIETFLNSVIDNKYDKMGILGFILPTTDREERWFCSELVSNCLKIIGDETFWYLDPSKISPNRLAILLDVSRNYKLNRVVTFPRIFNIGI